MLKLDKAKWGKLQKYAKNLIRSVVGKEIKALWLFPKEIY